MSPRRYAEFVKVMSRNKLRNWTCVDDVVRRKKIRLLCRDGSFRSYKIRVVKSCKCKKTTSGHNKTHRRNRTKRRKKKSGRRRRKRKGRTSNKTWSVS